MAVTSNRLKQHWGISGWSLFTLRMNQADLSLSRGCELSRGCVCGDTSSWTAHTVLAPWSRDGGGVLLHLSDVLTKKTKGQFSFLLFLIFKILATFFCSYRPSYFLLLFAEVIVLTYKYTFPNVTWLLTVYTSLLFVFLFNCFMLNVKLPQAPYCFLENCCLLSYYSCILTFRSIISSSLEWE